LAFETGAEWSLLLITSPLPQIRPHAFRPACRFPQPPPLPHTPLRRTQDGARLHQSLSRRRGANASLPSSCCFSPLSRRLLSSRSFSGRVMPKCFSTPATTTSITGTTIPSDGRGFSSMSKSDVARCNLHTYYHLEIDIYSPRPRSPLDQSNRNALLVPPRFPLPALAQPASQPASQPVFFRRNGYLSSGTSQALTHRARMLFVTQPTNRLYFWTPPRRETIG
jgi:hypothetical protein